MVSYKNNRENTLIGVPSDPVIYVAASEQFRNDVGIAEHLEITFLCSSPVINVNNLYVTYKFTVQTSANLYIQTNYINR
jgi:uncharacterized protein YigE (DUF2233 family)